MCQVSASYQARARLQKHRKSHVVTAARDLDPYRRNIITRQRVVRARIRASLKPQEGTLIMAGLSWSTSWRRCHLS